MKMSHVLHRHDGDGANDLHFIEFHRISSSCQSTESNQKIDEKEGKKE